MKRESKEPAGSFFLRKMEKELPFILPGQRPGSIIEAQKLTTPWLLEDLFPLTQQMEEVFKQGGNKSLEGIRGYNLFYEPSTRTRTSFEAAILHLGGQFSSTENARAFSSAVKGETLEDTIKIIQGYGYNYIVLRYDETGGAYRAFQVADIPILNAGDGAGQHPTQALLDVYTIYEQFGQVGDMRVAFVGDLKYGRTVRSLAYLLARFPKIEMDFVSPPALGINKDIKYYLEKHYVKYQEHDKIDGVLSEADVIYMTRQQLERVKKHKGLWMVVNRAAQLLARTSTSSVDYSKYTLDLQVLDRMKAHAKVLHPLPRGPELPPEVDSDPRVIPLRQAQNGLFIRMALLERNHGKAA